MKNLGHFLAGFERAVAKQKAETSVQTKQAQQMVSSNAITKATIAKLSEEQYKTSIITLAIAHIKKKWSNA